MHEVTIRMVANGYIVTVGCQTFVFPEDSAGVDDLFSRLRAYMSDPTGYEKKFLAACGNVKKIKAWREAMTTIPQVNATPDQPQVGSGPVSNVPGIPCVR